MTDTNRFTVAEACTAFLNSGRWRDRALPARLAWWTRELGSEDAKTLSPESIDAALGRLLRRGALDYAGKPTGRPVAPATFNRYRASLASVYKWLHEERLLPMSVPSPVRATKAKREGAGRLRYLTRDEYERLVAAARVCRYKRMAFFVRLAVASGLRLGNLRDIRWRDIDARGKTITIARTKAGREHVVPLHDELASDLERLRASPDHFVFRAERDGLRRAHLEKPWKACLRMAQLHGTGVSIHSLRHTCASWMAQQGIPLLTIAAALDHSSLNVTRRYAHLSVDERRSAVRGVFGGI